MGEDPAVEVASEEQMAEPEVQLPKAKRAIEQPNKVLEQGESEELAEELDRLSKGT